MGRLIKTLITSRLPRLTDLQKSNFKFSYFVVTSNKHKEISRLLWNSCCIKAVYLQPKVIKTWEVYGFIVWRSSNLFMHLLRTQEVWTKSVNKPAKQTEEETVQELRGREGARAAPSNLPCIFLKGEEKRDPGFSMRAATRHAPVWRTTTSRVKGVSQSVRLWQAVHCSG